MATTRSSFNALIIAGFITAFLIMGIANLSYTAQQKSVLDFDQPGSPCALSICSIV